MPDDKFPAPPEPKGDFPAERSSLSPIVWWIAAGIALITFLFLIPIASVGWKTSKRLTLPLPTLMSNPWPIRKPNWN